MAFEDLLKLQAYLRGNGRNPMAEAIQQRGARQRQLEDRAQQIFLAERLQRQRQEQALDLERQRQAFDLEKLGSVQQFQRSEGKLERDARETLAEKQADAYLNRWKAMQDGKLQGLYPKKPNETDEQWEERVGKAQADPVNRLLEDASDARKKGQEILREQGKRKQGEVLKRARKDAGFLATVEGLDKKTAASIRAGDSPEAAIGNLAKKNKDKAARALTAYEDSINRYAGTDDRGNPVLPDLTTEAIDQYNSLKEAEKMASDQARELIREYPDGQFKGGRYLKSIARELLGPRGGAVENGERGTGNAERETEPPPFSANDVAEEFLRNKASRGVKAAPGAIPTATPGAAPPLGNAERSNAERSNAERGTRNAEQGGGGMRNAERGTGNAEQPFAFPGRGVVPSFLNEALAGARENVLPPIEAGAAEVLRRGGVMGRNMGTAVAAPYRYLFSGEPIEFEEMGEDPGNAERGTRNAEQGGGVSRGEVHNFFVNELGMTPAQVAEHEEEKAQGNPEAIESEKEILSEILRRRALAVPRFSVDPSTPPLRMGP